MAAALGEILLDACFLLDVREEAHTVRWVWFGRMAMRVRSRAMFLRERPHQVVPEMVNTVV